MPQPGIVCKVSGMTNTDRPANYYNPTITASGRLSHKNCTHPSDAAHRHNCRYFTALERMAESAATRKPSEPVDAPIVIGTLN